MFRKRMVNRMDRDDLIFTLKMTALGTAALLAYIVFALVQDGGASDLIARLVAGLGLR